MSPTRHLRPPKKISQCQELIKFYRVFGLWGPMESPKLHSQGITKATGCPSQPDVKTLLLKTTLIYVVKHRSLAGA